MTDVRVLIADDDDTLRRALAALIEVEDGLELVGVAVDADEAIELTQLHRPDVVLVDVKMPGGGGTRAAREILAVSPGTQVIALSAYEDHQILTEMMQAGAAGYLVKGTRGNEILEAIHRAGGAR